MPLAEPAALAEVKLSEPFAGDGLALPADGHLFATAPYAGEVLEVASVDGWRSARVVGRMKTSEAATTTGMTLRDGVAYAMNSHFGEMKADPPVAAFEIFRGRPK